MHGYPNVPELHKQFTSFELSETSRRPSNTQLALILSAHLDASLATATGQGQPIGIDCRSGEGGAKLEPRIPMRVQRFSMVVVASAFR